MTEQSLFNKFEKELILKQKAVALFSVSTIMVLKGISAPAAMDNSYDRDRLDIMVSNGIDSLDAKTILEWDLNYLVVED